MSQHHALTAAAADSTHGPADIHARSSVQVHHGSAQLPADAVKLLHDREVDDIQFGFDWLRNLERTVFQGERVRVLYFVLRQVGDAVAVLPMVERVGRWGTNLEALANYYTSLYAPALRPGLRPRALRPLIDAMRTQCAPLRSVRLAPMDPASPGYEALRQALMHGGFAVFGFRCFANWHYDDPPPWERYLAERQGPLRNTIKRMTRKVLGSDGRIEIITRVADLPRGLDAYQHVYDRSWKVAEPHPEFIPELARLCAERGWLRLGVVWIGDAPAAAQLWIVAHGRAEIFKLAYDEAYKSHAPGTVLSAALMRHVLDVDRVAEVDYLTGDDAYKKEWMKSRRMRWGMVAYNTRSISGIIAASREAAGRAAKTLVGRLRGARPALE